MALAWGIGKPASQVQDGGHHTRQFVISRPLATDPQAGRRTLPPDRDEPAQRRPLGQAASAHPDARRVAAPTLRTEDGTEVLDIIGTTISRPKTRPLRPMLTRFDSRSTVTA